jgi:hypothetical protein
MGFLLVKNVLVNVGKKPTDSSSFQSERAFCWLIYYVLCARETEQLVENCIYVGEGAGWLTCLLKLWNVKHPANKIQLAFPKSKLNTV